VNDLLFDSFALLRFFQKEPGSGKVKRLLEESLESGQSRLVNAINVGEMIYINQRRFGEQAKLQMIMHLQSLEFTILPCPNDLIFRAAELKARYPISYADAFALASAIEHSADLVTGDPEFSQVESLVRIIWV
jgi:ribonuclease VapC